MRGSSLTSICFRFAGILLASLAVGCASWSDRDSQENRQTKLPELKQNPKSLVLKVDFVPIDIDTVDADDLDSLWQWVDETIVDSATRQQWFANGLRTGRVIRHDRFRSRLETMTTAQNAVDQFLAEAEVASEVSHSGSRIPMRLGRRYELPLRQPMTGSHAILVQVAGKIIGQTLQDPQFMFAITPRPGDSPMQIELTLRPEIQHGVMRQQWVSSDTALRIDRRRDSWSLDELDLNLKASQDDLFVIAGTQPQLGLGEQMLRGRRADSMQQQVVMLIQVVQIPRPTSQL